MPPKPSPTKRPERVCSAIPEARAAYETLEPADQPARRRIERGLIQAELAARIEPK